MKGSTSPSGVPVSGIKLGAEEVCRAEGLVASEMLRSERRRRCRARKPLTS